MKTLRFSLAAGIALFGIGLQADSTGSDLARYVSRPDLRAPLLTVTTHDDQEITPGYWFTAPYAELLASDLTPEYLPYQSGPHIYDHRGELIWSGSSWSNHRNVFDFRMAQFNGSKVLTGVMGPSRHPHSDDEFGFILDENYEMVKKVDMSIQFNQHEFNMIDDDYILIATAPRIFSSLADLSLPQFGCSIIADGFREYDPITNTNTFTWSPLSHLSLNESYVATPPNFRYEWDAFHLNSVTRDPMDGSYLISLRHTSTVYKISGIDGSVIWRLGGKFSDFTQDFNFSSQHHVRILSQDATTTIISLFDNGADDQDRQPRSANASSVKIIRIHDHEGLRPYRAELLMEYVRPDRGLTDRRGSAQFLSNGHAFISWSENGYLSEHTADGRPVLEAKFAGKRFSTYRAYHFADWVGVPVEAPALVADVLVSGGNEERGASTVLYVSWNGATEVKRWRFYGASEYTGNETTTGGFEMLGSVSKVGFESSIAVPGYWRYTYAEAEDGHDNVIGRSKIIEAAWSGGLPKDFGQEKSQVWSSVPDLGSFVVLLSLTYSAISILLWGWRRCYRTQKRQAHHWKTGGETAFLDEDLVVFSRLGSMSSQGGHIDGHDGLGEKQFKVS